MAKMEPVVNANAISRISAGTIIKGEIISPCDIRIDGTFEGKIQSKGRVVVGESAHIKGDIVCDSIDLWGKVEGKERRWQRMTWLDSNTDSMDMNLRKFWERVEDRGAWCLQPMGLQKVRHE